MFLLLQQRVKYRKKVPLGTGTEFQVPIPVLVPVQMWTVPNPTKDGTKFHVSCKLAKKCLCVLVTSSPSESFSAIGNSVMPQSIS